LGERNLIYLQSNETYSMDEFEKAKLIAYRFLSYRPRSKKEIENKLIEKKISRNTITNILDFLEENNYINDKDFSINWIKYRLENKPMGRAFLEYELRKKGVSRELISESLNKVFGEEFNENDIAIKVAQKKLISLRKNKADNYILKRRLFNYLHRKGFSLDTIEQVISGILTDNKYIVSGEK